MKLKEVLQRIRALELNIERYKKRVSELKAAEKYVQNQGVWDTGVEGAFHREYASYHRLIRKDQAALERLLNVEVDDEALNRAWRGE